jgi:uncharacterized protein (DUF2384 family)
MSRTAARTTSAEPDTGAILATGAFRAARFLDVAQGELADIIGVSGATASRLAHGRSSLEPGSKPFQLAALFVRAFRSLDAIVGSDDAAARAWMRAPNRALGGVPLELMRDPAGLALTVDYLDAARARL